ncbi:CheR family methyltransferase [Bowmanella dokdonensis]|uniref:Chemotaxis protein methyltransferase n=1 Tax=Bowmanella dokdonensis TaxID=751969 RepID=A0A939DRV7_9ALTE|nr:protein-glutamate O-methyltransferase CheR [Bowmanella dokdonensis]MBN7827080.1 protein-glutamate O-methyltransferase CheR [Bowmanella dokdonensis]
MTVAGCQGLSAQDHDKVAEFIGKTVGIQLPPHKRQLIETRLRKRQKATGKSTISDYLAFALSAAGEGERQALVDALTTNKTDFFREPGHFEFLQRHLRARLDAGATDREYRFWSAACSSGEEPYTLAMVLAELNAERGGFHFHIDATDISESMLACARAGIYREDRIAPVPIPLRKKYLLRSRDPAKRLVKVDNALRARVNFSQFNLIAGSYPAEPCYDVILCRNVMIYFCERDRSLVINRLKASLKPGGLLILGHSESVGNQRQGLDVLSPTIYQRVPCL